ncbi:MAG: tetratricopeptide repeat protein [Candidatus Neomarinimicrobiota bacterium]
MQRTGPPTRSNAQQDQLKELSQRVDALESKLNQLMGVIVPDVENALNVVVKSRAQSDSTTILLINRINTIQNKMKIVEDRAEYSDSTNLEMLEQLLMIENKIVTLTRSFNELYALRSGVVEPGDLRIRGDDFRLKYVEALSQYQNGHFQIAIDGFSSLAASGLDHKLADNSQYWLAESYYALKNYRRAIKEFGRVFEFKGGDKWDDAQLKIGLCYQRIGNTDRAKSEFQKLLDHFPDSEYYQKAQQYLRQL